MCHAGYSTVSIAEPAPAARLCEMATQTTEKKVTRDPLPAGADSSAQESSSKQLVTRAIDVGAHGTSAFN
jgi:hypothetical protein